MGEIEQLKAKILELQEENEALQKSRATLREKILELHNDLTQLGTFCVVIVDLMRKVQPINEQMMSFYTKYHIDKIDMSKGDEVLSEEEKAKRKGKISVMRWSAMHVTDIPEIIRGIKDLVHEFSPIINNLAASNQLDSLYPAMSTLFKYIHHALNEEEKQWFLNKISTKQLPK